MTSSGHPLALQTTHLTGNVRAIRFYERLGFRFVGQRWYHCHVMRLERPR